MKFKKIYIPRIFIVLCLALTCAGLIRIANEEDVNGLLVLIPTVLLGITLILYLILLGYSFSSIGKNSPWGLLAVSLLPVIFYCWYLFT